MAAKREPWTPLLKSYPESRKINAVSIGAETMFTRLLAKVDDGSNYYADDRLLLAELYGHRFANGSVSETDMARWRDELVTIGLVQQYNGGGEGYLHIVEPRKFLRADIKPDIRFPPFTQPLTRTEDTESVTDAAQVRNGSGPDSAHHKIRDAASKAEKETAFEEAASTTSDNSTALSALPSGGAASAPLEPEAANSNDEKQKKKHAPTDGHKEVVEQLWQSLCDRKKAREDKAHALIRGENPDVKADGAKPHETGDPGRDDPPWI